MGKLIIAIVVVAAFFYAWNKGLIQEWAGPLVGKAVDKGAQSVKSTQREATKVRPADPGALEEKK